MTKAELIEKQFDLPNGFDVIDVEDVLKFFESNVCIPKGENRIPEADVLHKLIEDMNKEIQYFHKGDWYTTCISIDEYRIKPSELVYEYQWLSIINKQAHIVGDGRFHTIEELKKFTTYVKIEQTKRIRQ